MSPLAAIWNQFAMLVDTTEVNLLVIAGFIILGTGLLTPRPSHLTTATLVALIVYALANYVTALGTGLSALEVARESWDKFVALPMLSLLAYVISFGLLISAIHLIRKYVLLR